MKTTSVRPTELFFPPVNVSSANSQAEQQQAVNAPPPKAKRRRRSKRSAAPVLASLDVPYCRLQYGEHLRVVGSCRELGRWDPSKAPQLSWYPGHQWQGSVVLPPGEQLAFKLAIMRGDGRSVHWEQGADRQLTTPQLPGTATSASTGSRTKRNSGSTSSKPDSAEPELRITCAFDYTTDTRVQCSRLQAKADAAVARLAAIQRERKELTARVVESWQAAQESEARIARLQRDMEELAKLDQALHAQTARTPADMPAEPAVPPLALAVLTATLESAYDRLVSQLLPGAAVKLQSQLAQLSASAPAPAKRGRRARRVVAAATAPQQAQAAAVTAP